MKSISAIIALTMILTGAAAAGERGFADFLARFREAPLPLVIDAPLLEKFDPAALTRISDADIRRHILEKLPGGGRGGNAACLAIDEFFDLKGGASQKMPVMYYFARVPVSDKFHSIIVLLDDNDARFPMPARYYILINVARDGTIIDSKTIAWVFSLMKLQCETGRVGRNLSIEETWMGFDPGEQDLGTATSRDRRFHYSRVAPDGRFMSEQPAHYPCAGTFVDKKSGKALCVEQNENLFAVMFGDPWAGMKLLNEQHVDLKRSTFGFSLDGIRHRAEFRNGMKELHVTNEKTGSTTVFVRDPAYPVW